MIAISGEAQFSAVMSGRVAAAAAARRELRKLLRFQQTRARHLTRRHRRLLTVGLQLLRYAN